MIEEALSSAELGPCLSNKLAEHLTHKYGITPAAARQKISRAGPAVKRLAHLPFPRRVRFMYLQQDYASHWYWHNLFQAIYDTNGPYARALGAVEARRVVPLADFDSACGSPIAQKKHLGSRTVLQRMMQADILVTESLPGLGPCVMTKELFEAYRKSAVIQEPALTRARLIAERALLDSIKEWLRRLGMASFDRIKLRGDEGPPPQVGTFTWDLSAPCYLAPLLSWQRGQNTPSPGFVVCDVLLNSPVKLRHIEPFIHKVKTLQSIKTMKRVFFIFVADRYSREALRALKEVGVIPGTPESLFGKEIAEAFKELVGALTKAAMGALNPEKFDEMFNRLSKLEGAMGNMRGAFFELLVAHIVRKESQGQLVLNKACRGLHGTEAEVDVFLLQEGKSPRMIECKGMAPGTQVSDDEIGKWLTVRINRVRQHLERIEAVTPNGPKPRFELWTSGYLSQAAQNRIYKTREANKAKFDLIIMGPDEIRDTVKSDKALLSTLEHHFLPQSRKIEADSEWLG